ncbi:hypothetical protein DB322_08335, partial [Ligilactobacillus salivarius]
ICKPARQIQASLRPVIGSTTSPFFFFKQKTGYEIGVRLLGPGMCIKDRRKGECSKTPFRK